jgi:hypothetical protein
MSFGVTEPKTKSEAGAALARKKTRGDCSNSLRTLTRSGVSSKNFVVFDGAEDEESFVGGGVGGGVLPVGTPLWSKDPPAGSTGTKAGVICFPKRQCHNDKMTKGFNQEPGKSVITSSRTRSSFLTGGVQSFGKSGFPFTRGT